MAGKKKHRGHHEEEHENHERWLITYADMITLLMVLFIVLYAISQVDSAKFEKLKDGLADGFGGKEQISLLEGGAGITDGGLAPVDLALTTAGTEAGDGDGDGAEKGPPDLRRARTSLAEALQKAGLDKDVEFRNEERGLVVSIVTDDVLFKPGSAEWDSEGHGVLDTVAPILASMPNAIAVEGHTDNVPISGRYASNWELSTARATTVLRLLIEQFEVSPSRVSASGYADQRPIDTNDSAEGRAKNRRVEIVIQSAEPKSADPAPVTTTAVSTTAFATTTVATTVATTTVGDTAPLHTESANAIGQVTHSPTDGHGGAAPTTPASPSTTAPEHSSGNESQGTHHGQEG